MLKINVLCKSSVRTVGKIQRWVKMVSEVSKPSIFSVVLAAVLKKGSIWIHNFLERDFSMQQ